MAAPRPAPGPSAGWSDGDVERALSQLIARDQYARGLSREARTLVRSAFTAIADDLRALQGREGVTAIRNRQRLSGLLADYDAMLGQAYTRVRELTMRELGGLYAVEQDAARLALGQTIVDATPTAQAAPAILRSGAFVSVARVESIAAFDLGGRTLGAWWDKERRDMSAAVRGAIQVGMAKGDDVLTIARRIVPASGSREPAVQRQALARAATIVRTAHTAIVSDAALTAYEDMGAEVTGAYEWLSTRDDRTSTICLALDGQQFTYDDPKRRVPPAHLNCRSTIIPVPNWTAIGLPEPGPRSPLSIPTMATWLRKQPKATQVKMLGASRAAAFRARTLPLAELLDADGRVRTLPELRAFLVDGPRAQILGDNDRPAGWSIRQWRAYHKTGVVPPGLARPGVTPPLPSADVPAYLRGVPAAANVALVEDASSAWSRAVEAAARAEGLSVDEYRRRADTQVRALVDGAAVWRRDTPEAIEAVLRDGRWKSAVELAPAGPYAKARRTIERVAFNVPEDTPDHARPIYGYLAGDPDGGATGAAQYGSVSVRFKRGLRTRTTLQEGDSLAITRRGALSGDVLPMRASDADARAFYHTRTPKGTPLLRARRVEDVAGADEYVEAQLHGGVTLDDVEEVVFTRAADEQRLGAQLRARGIRTRVAGQRPRPDPAPPPPDPEPAPVVIPDTRDPARHPTGRAWRDTDRPVGMAIRPWRDAVKRGDALTLYKADAVAPPPTPRLVPPVRPAPVRPAPVPRPAPAKPTPSTATKGGGIPDLPLPPDADAIGGPLRPGETFDDRRALRLRVERVARRNTYKERPADEVIAEIDALLAEHRGQLDALDAELSDVEARMAATPDHAVRERLPMAQRKVQLEEARRRLTDGLRAQIHEAMRVNHPATLNLAVEKVDGATAHHEARTVEARKWTESVMSRALAPAPHRQKVRLHGYAHRAQYEPVGHRAMLYANSGTGVHVHEIMHGIEVKEPGLLSSSVAYRNGRARSLTQRRLNQLLPGTNYRDDEVVLPMDAAWPMHERSHAYAAKVYANSVGFDYSTEIMSVGVEKLYSDPVGFIRRDRDFARYVLRALRGDLDTEVDRLYPYREP